MEPIHILKAVDELDAVADASHTAPVALFKHSLTCPISARAQEQFVNIGGVPRYALAVQYAQDISQAVTERFATPHASPQLLIISKGEVTLALTHDDIRAETVAARL